MLEGGAKAPPPSRATLRRFDSPTLRRFDASKSRCFDISLTTQNSRLSAKRKKGEVLLVFLFLFLLVVMLVCACL